MVIGVIVGLCILLLIRHDRLRPLYAFWWMGVAAGVIFLGLCPKVVDHIASYLGIHYPPVLVIVVAISLLLIKILTMDLERTKQEQQLRLLAQQLSLLEEELRSLREAQVKDGHQDGHNDRPQEQTKKENRRRFKNRQKTLRP